MRRWRLELDEGSGHGAPVLRGHKKVKVAAGELEHDDFLALLWMDDEGLEVEASGIHDDFRAVHARERLDLKEPAPHTILRDGLKIGLVALGDRAVRHLVVPLGEVFGLVLLEVLDNLGAHFESALRLGLVLQELQAFADCPKEAVAVLGDRDELHVFGDGALLRTWPFWGWAFLGLLCFAGGGLGSSGFIGRRRGLGSFSGLCRVVEDGDRCLELGLGRQEAPGASGSDGLARSVRPGRGPTSPECDLALVDGDGNGDQVVLRLSGALEEVIDLGTPAPLAHKLDRVEGAGEGMGHLIGGPVPWGALEKPYPADRAVGVPADPEAELAVSGYQPILWSHGGAAFEVG